MEGSKAVQLGYWTVAIIVYLFAVSQMQQQAAVILSVVLVLGALIYNQRAHAAARDGNATVFDTLNNI